MKFFPGDQESSFAFFSLSCVWSTCPLLATAWSCARHAAAQPGPLVRLQGALRTVSRLLDSEKPGGLGKSPRGALSLSVKSIAHGLPITTRVLARGRRELGWRSNTADAHLGAVR